MAYHINEAWLTKSDEKTHREFLAYYIKSYTDYLASLSVSQQRKECLSGLNRIQRMDLWSSDGLKIDVRIGDICYLDYGLAFINEAGYQHFGLVMAFMNYKVLVVPMTSNTEMIRQARNVSQQGKKHLYYIGRVAGLNKASVLFLNDIKFINSARIISVNGHIDSKSKMFREIQEYIQSSIF